MNPSEPPLPKLNLSHHDGLLANLMEDLEGDGVPPGQAHFRVDEAEEMLKADPTLKMKHLEGDAPAQDEYDTDELLDEAAGYQEHAYSDEPNQDTPIKNVKDDPRKGSRAPHSIPPVVRGRTATRRATRGRNHGNRLPQGLSGYPIHSPQTRHPSLEKKSWVQSQPSLPLQPPINYTAEDKPKLIKNFSPGESSSSLKPDDKKQGFDHKSQLAIIGKVFGDHNLQCEKVMENSIIAKGVLKMRVITQEELTWYCEGILAERASSMMGKLESVVAQLSGEMSRIQTTSKKLSDTEHQARENVYALSKMRYSEAGSSACSDAGSYQVSPQREPEMFPQSPGHTSADIMEYRSLLLQLGVTKALVVNPKLTPVWPSVVPFETLQSLRLSEITEADKHRILKAIMAKLEEEVAGRDL